MNDWNFLLDRVSRRDAHIRAGDEDRERVAERLRTGHTEGRLDIAEFQDRIGRCYEAKTLGQLDELVSDLPRREERRSSGRRPSRWLVARVLPIVVVLLVVSAVTEHHGHHAFWLWIPLLFVIWRLSAWRRRSWWAGPRRGW